MKGLIVATQFLTRLPTPHLTVSRAEFGASMRWFPAVGLIVGALVYGGTTLGALVDPWLGALIGLCLWVSITGALHLDGLGDVADACGAAHKDREHMLAVLGDPHVGSFAVVSIALQLVAKLILLRLLIASGPLITILLVPCAARIGPLMWTRWLPSLHEGLAAQFRNSLRISDILIWTALLAMAATISPILLAAFILIPLWAWWLLRKLGGISGDGHGAGIELIETGLLMTASVAPHLT